MPIPFECLTTLDKAWKIHIPPKTRLNVFALKELSGRYCPNFKPELQRYYETEGYQSSLKEYEEVFGYISDRSGGDYRNFDDAYSLYNDLFVEVLTLSNNWFRVVVLYVFLEKYGKKTTELDWNGFSGTA